MRRRGRREARTGGVIILIRVVGECERLVRGADLIRSWFRERRVASACRDDEVSGACEGVVDGRGVGEGEWSSLVRWMVPLAGKISAHESAVTPRVARASLMVSLSMWFIATQLCSPIGRFKGGE